MQELFAAGGRPSAVWSLVARHGGSRRSLVDGGRCGGATGRCLAGGVLKQRTLASRFVAAWRLLKAQNLLLLCEQRDSDGNEEDDDDQDDDDDLAGAA